MAATFEWDEANGAGETVTHNVTQTNWKNTDDKTDKDKIENVVSDVIGTATENITDELLSEYNLYKCADCGRETNTIYDFMSNKLCNDCYKAYKEEYERAKYEHEHELKQKYNYFSKDIK